MYNFPKCSNLLNCDEEKKINDTKVILNSVNGDLSANGTLSSSFSFKKNKIFKSVIKMRQIQASLSRPSAISEMDGKLILMTTKVSVKIKRGKF